MSSLRPTLAATVTMAVAILLALAGSRAGAQPQLPVPPADPTLVFSTISSELVLPAVDLAGGWLELTSLASDRDPLVLRLGERSADDPEKRLSPNLPAGPMMLCSGGEPFAVRCAEIYWQRRLAIEASGDAESNEIEVELATGVEVTGRYLLDRWPVAGARLAVVPADLEAARPYTMPLGRGARGKMLREVVTDDGGNFVLPALAEGRYFLETVLPSGRVHRGEPFDLPSERAVRAAALVDDVAAVSWDLGDVDVADGPVVEIRVRDPEDRPVRGARVAGRQGADPLAYVGFEATSGRDGSARLSGFAVERPILLRCSAEGYAALEVEYELVPAIVLCLLEPLGSVIGEVAEVGGLVPPATVSLTAAAAPGKPSAAESIAARVDLAGGFTFGGLEAGEYRLVAAAPGFEAAETSFVLAAGERLQLEAIFLSPGEEIGGRVVDSAGGRPVTGAEIHALEPPGATRTVSDEDGAFTLTRPGGRRLRLRVSAEGYAAREVEVAPKIQDGDGDPLVVKLTRAGWIRALVWDEAGRPCPGCRLVLRPGGEELVTDDRGAALSGPLEGGHYRVQRPRVHHLGSTVIELRDGETRYATVEPGRIATVRFGDRPQDLRVIFEPPSDPGWTLSARNPWRTERVQREVDGSFRLRRRPGESLELFVHFFDPAAGAEAEVRQATVPADLESEVFVVPRRSARVRGRAASGDRPIAGVAVTLRSLEGALQAAARTGADGGFQIPYLPPGVYALAIGEPNVRMLSLRDRQALDLGTIELLPGGY